MLMTQTKIYHFICDSCSATKNKSDIKVLALTLRDGVLLCNLIHFLDPYMEPKEFNQRPKDAQVEVGL